MIRRGFTIIELAVSIGILVVVMLAAITVFLYSKSITTISSEASLAKHGAELMLDMIRADAGGIPNFADVYATYGGTEVGASRLAFGYDTAAPQDSVLHPARFGWVDPVSGRPRLRNAIGWLFAAVDADERVDPPTAAPGHFIAETLFAGPGPFGGAGIDLNGDRDADDDVAGLNAGAGNSYTGELLPVTIVVVWDSSEAGSRRTYKLRTIVPRED